jgi:transcriptional antiterminator Rof (Rho-off)
MATEQQEHLKIEQLRQHSADELEHIAGREKENLEGWIPSLASDEEIHDALEKAFDYRGDVTLTLKDGRQINGYIFDRRSGKTLADSSVRIIPATERTKLTVPYSDIAALAFTGRDTAAGKSFEAWVKKYWEKKAAGEKNIAIEPEKLD